MASGKPRAKRVAELQAAGRTKQSASTREWEERNPLGYMLYQLRNNADRRGIQHSLTLQDLKDVWPADGKCPVFGVPLVLPKAASGKQPDRASIDRIDRNHGYQKGNIAFMSWRANQIKGSATSAELKAVALWLERQERIRELF